MARARSKKIPKIEEFADILPALPIMPDENPEDFEVFQAGLLNELAPITPYQNIIAQNIIANEWEMFRLRRWRKALIVDETEKQLLDRFEKTYDLNDESRDDTTNLTKVAMGGSRKEQPVAVKDLEDEYGFDTTRSISIAFTTYGGRFDRFELQIMAIESRRKRLWEDYSALQAVSQATLTNDNQANGKQANGKQAPKIFNLAQKEFLPGEIHRFQERPFFKHITTC